MKHLSLGGGQDEAAIQEIFLRECQSLASLRYRGLPEIIEFFFRDAALFLLLEYSLGISLLEFVYPETTGEALRPAGKRMLPDLERVLHWSTELAETLVFLHEQKPFPVLHRNLNPLTVRIVQPGEGIQLIDFGLLNALRSGVTLTGDGLASLTPNPFADPDLLVRRWPDLRVDIYAFGRILDFMLTGAIPEKPEAPPAFPTADSIIDADTRAVLASIITRCCQPAPDDRYDSMAAVLADLARLRSDAAASPSERISCVCGQQNRRGARFCERCGQLLHLDGQAEGTVSTGVPIAVSYDGERDAALLTRYRQGHIAPLSRFRLREVLDEVQSDPGFEELISLESLPRVEKLPHQREASLRALRQMRGRALLADEVGLGKTIETGIILKELVLRQLAYRIVIFCPVQLLGQWQSELYEKFGEIFLVLGRDIDTSLAWHCSRLIAPYEIARQRSHVEEILRQRYDLVILDEAHYLNYPENERILRTMKSIQKKYFLLVSATPMHNSLDELYNIITLLRPGHFADLDNFRQQFVDPEDRTRPRNIEVLRGIVRQVMIRNSRRQVAKDYPFPERQASTVSLDLDPHAAAFYDQFREFYRQSLAEVTNPKLLLRMGELVERLCSSSEAFREPVNRLKRDRYVQKQLGPDFMNRLETFAARYPPAFVAPKIRATEEALRRFVSHGQKVLVFSQFNETAQDVYQQIRQSNLLDHCFFYNEKDPIELRMKALGDFRHSRAGVLFCPGEASEGLNLQFASVMINFDLPWDPMKLEQRIGRIQRIGGQQKVIIVNLVLKNTIEEEILKICQDKIRMFGEVFGQVEEILGNLREEDDFRTMICDLFLDRAVEDEEGQSVSAREYLEDVLDEATQKSSADQETNVVNMIYFELEPEEEEGKQGMVFVNFSDSGREP